MENTVSVRPAGSGGRTSKLRHIAPEVVKSKATHVVWVIFRTVLLLGLAYLILYPILVKLSVSFMSRADMSDMSVHWIPRHPTLANYRDVLQLIDYFQYLAVTLLDTVGVTLLQLIACTLVGYGFARFNFRFKKLLFFCVILTLVVPQEAYRVSSYMMFRNFDFFGLGSIFHFKLGSLLNTPLPAIILSIGCQGTKNGLFIYIMRLFFESLPKEIEESAWVDGAGVFRTFVRIMLPNTVPALTTVGVLGFIWRWNDLYAASTYTPNWKLMALLLNRLTTEITRAEGGMSAALDNVRVSMLTNAGALLILLPLIILFLIVQRFFIEGVEHTGLTGM